MSSSIRHEVRNDASLPVGTVRHIRTERRAGGGAAEAFQSDALGRPRADQQGDKAGADAAAQSDSTDIDDQEIRSSKSPDDQAVDGDDDFGKQGTALHRNAHAPGKHASSQSSNDALVQLFEEIHTIVRELDGQGREIGERSESTKTQPLGFAKPNDPRLDTAITKRLRADGSGDALLDERVKVKTKNGSHGAPA